MIFCCHDLWIILSIHNIFSFIYIAFSFDFPLSSFFPLLFPFTPTLPFITTSPLFPLLFTRCGPRSSMPPRPLRDPNSFGLQGLHSQNMGHCSCKQFSCWSRSPGGCGNVMQDRIVRIFYMISFFCVRKKLVQGPRMQ